MGVQFQTFSKKQLMILTWWSPKSPVKDKDTIIADGAVRSGKTVAMSLSFIMWAMTTFSSQVFILAGKTVGSFRRNVLLSLKDTLIKRGYKVTERRTDNLLVVKSGNRENLFFYFGGKDEGSQDLIQGLTAAGAFFDEVALMPESFVNQATARCSVEGAKFWFNCNPASQEHWFKKGWIDHREQRNALYLHFTMDDNPSLSEAVKARYRSQYSGLFYKRYIDGEWAVAEGIIYDMWDDARHVVNDVVPHSGESFISCDYGTQNAMVFLLWQKFGDQWICEKEYYYSGRDKRRQKTDGEYADDMLTFIGSAKVKQIFVDPSAASFIAELRKRGLKVSRAINDVSDGIRFVSSALNDRKILFSEDCRMCRKEFVMYAWDPKAAMRGEDKPIKENDHCMDAVRYFVTSAVYRPKARLNTGLKGGV